MFSVDKNIEANVVATLVGKSTIDDEVVARYSAYIDQDNGPLTITTIIYDEEKYKSDCSDDESEFIENVYDYEKQVMDKEEDIAGLFKEDDNSDNSDSENDDSKDSDDKASAGSEETIVP